MRGTFRPTALQLAAFPLAALGLALLAQPFRPSERGLPFLRKAPPPQAPVLPPPTPPVAAQPAGVPAPAASATAAASPRPAPKVERTQGPEAVPYPGEADREALMARFPPLSDRSWAEVDGESARWLHTHGAVFLDARRSTQFREGHVAGARSLPAWEAGLAERVQLLAMLAPDPRLPFVIYCSGGECQDSHVVAEALRGQGFVNLRIYRDGFPDWVAQGGPVARR